MLNTICYLSGFSIIENEFLNEIETQRQNIQKYLEKENISVDKIFVEKFHVNDTNKPVLLNLIHDYYSEIKKIIMVSPDVISHNKDFQYWISDELKRIGIEIIYINNDEEVANKNILKKTGEIQNKVKSIPSLPHVITKVMEVIQNKDASAKTLSEVIAKDLGLTSKVLKIVNSSFYGFEKQITSIQQAIVVLGFTTIKGIVLSAGIFKMFSPRKNNIFDYEKFWQHSILTALGAKFLSNKILETEEDIFSPAFLHDLGKLILAQYDWDNYVNVYKTLEEDLDYEKNLADEEMACGINHCEIGFSILKNWNLPQIFCDVCMYHHTPQLSEQNKLLCIIVNISDNLVNNILYDRMIDTESLIPEDISIDSFVLEEVREYLKEQAENVKDITGFFN